MNPVNRFFTITFINRKTTDNQANKLMAWLLAVRGSLECTPDLALHFLDDMLNMLDVSIVVKTDLVTEKYVQRYGTAGREE